MGGQDTGPSCLLPSSASMRFLSSGKIGCALCECLIAVLLSTTFALGQGGSSNSFTAIPPEQASRYHIDFARHFFASPEVEKAERANLSATLSQLESLKGKVASSAANLQRALELNDRVQIQFRRHYAYLYLRNAVNT